MKTLRKPSSVSSALKKAETSISEFVGLRNKTPSGYTIKLANTLEEREAAYRLAYQVYLKKGYVKPNSNGWLVKNQDADAETAVLIVLDSNKIIIGTVTLIFDGIRQLPAMAIYPNEINILKSQNEKIVEISRLAIAPDHRGAKEILVLLFNYLYIFCYYVKGYSCLTIEVTPKHRDYYKALLCFDVIGDEKSNPIVEGTTGVLLKLLLDIAAAVKDCTHATQNKKNRTLYPQFIRSDLESMAAEYLEKQYKPISAEEKLYFGLSDSTVGTPICK